MSIPVTETLESQTPVEQVSQLVSYLEAGGRPKEMWKIGTEHEKFPFLSDTLTPVPYEGERSISALLKGLAQRFKWKPFLENEKIVGLLDPTSGATISLEPGGQFELSGAPLGDLHATCLEVHNHLSQIREIADPLGIGFLGVGFTPSWKRQDIPVMPKGRYQIMSSYMQKKGKLGQDMMFRSCTVQVNLDFSNEADMIRKMRVSLALQPIVTAIFSASPFTEGKPNGYQSFRSAVWLDTDPDRTGMLPFVFEDGFGFERYVDYALDVPMYFIYRQGKYIDVSGRSFRDFMAGRLPELPNQIPTLRDWADHLTTIFPEVRLKRYIEMRGADSGPWRRICALSAIWVGLLYDQDMLTNAWDLVKTWTAKEREQLRKKVPAHGLHAKIKKRTAQDVAKDVLKLSRHGLEKRALLGCKQQSESQFLDVLDEIVMNGKTPSDDLLSLYHGNWRGNIERIYRDFAF